MAGLDAATFALTPTSNPARSLEPGMRVRLAASSPIESEGVAPAPGDEGELLAPPVQLDDRRCWTVRFFHYSLPFSIPEKHLIALE